MKAYRITVATAGVRKGFFQHYFTTDLGLVSKEEAFQMTTDFRKRFPHPQFKVTCMSSDATFTEVFG